MTGHTFHIAPGGGLNGTVRVAGDKSISHRAIILGSLAEGVSRVSGFLQAEDAMATLAAFRAMGVVIDGPNNGVLDIHGVGLKGLKASSTPLDLGNSGTSMRLLCGLLAGQPFDSILTGDESLSKRPMRRVTDPLALMGGQVSTTTDGTAPLRIDGNPDLRGIEYRLPVASAQIKSCLLLAGLFARGTTTVIEPGPSRDHTERMLEGFSCSLEVKESRISINSTNRLVATDIDVPADISSAAFFMVGALIAPNSSVRLEHVGINPTRTGIIRILKLMGANIIVSNPRTAGGEEIADIQVTTSSLKGIHIPEHLVPLAIDEFPIVFIAAACAEGETVLTGAAELRVKESDRIQVMADGLNSLGISARPTSDGMVIRGGELQGGEVRSHGDHRIAMSFAIAGLRARQEISILNCENVKTSFPDFVSSARSLGLNIAETGVRA